MDTRFQHWPVGDAERRFERAFGIPYYRGAIHNGIDFACPVGTPVRAVGDGRAVSVSSWGPPGGLVLVCSHHLGERKVSIYLAHLGWAVVRPPDSVRAGQTIAFTGVSGSQKHPHLHFAIEEGAEWGLNRFVDPLDFLPATWAMRARAERQRAFAARRVTLLRMQDELEAMERHPAVIAALQEAERSRKSELEHGRWLYAEADRKRRERYPVRGVEYATLR